MIKQAILMCAALAAAAPAAAQSCVPGPYLLFFDWNSADIPAEAQQILSSVAEQYKQCGDARIAIDGHTDTSQSAARNDILSLQRADAVKATLRALGLRNAPMQTMGLGARNLRVQTGAGVRELQNRRVEITFEAP